MVLWSSVLNAGDTLFTHPKYVPLVYENGEYNFYKYTPKYIPDDLFHAFKILGTIDTTILDQFSERSIEEVIERGIFDRGYRIRKEFCLESYSAFTQYFHSFGIFSPFVMQTYILLSFHQYLRGESIGWYHNKKLALEDMRLENREWKKRARQLFNSYEYNRTLEPAPAEELSEDDWIYAW